MTEQDDDLTLPADPGAAPVKKLGRYELLDRLGKGGMGVVYRARDTQLDRLVAVKLLLTDLEADSETRERFLREARSAGELNHRNIIQIYDFGEDAGRAFIVMELLEGESLNEFLKSHPDVPLERTLQIMTGVCDGLAFSHSRSIIHRDLKPANLFITTDGQVKVLDFGLAKVASSKLTRSGLVFGTPDYMSPEQVRGKAVDERSDLFSLGGVFYQMLCRRKPFAAKSLPEVMRKVLTEDPPPLGPADATPSLARLVARLLQKEPLKRYQRAEEVLTDLRNIDPNEAPEAGAAPGRPRQIDRYEIEEQLGQGGMGVVYRARDPVLDRDVAIKSMLVDFGDDPDARARFQQEARAAARLQHPNIVTIYEFGEKDDSPYLIMEFLEGVDLEALELPKTLRELARRLEIIGQLCDGLAFAHGQGVVHRDIKPGNVRVLEDGTVKLLDFGIATIHSSDRRPDTVGGSAGYTSPEMLAAEPVDARSDVFSVGVLTYELLTGRQPFTGDSATAIAYQVLHEDPPSARSIVPELPESIDAVLDRALAKKPEARWSTAGELGEAVRAVAREIQAVESARQANAGPTPSIGGSGTAGNLTLEPGGNAHVSAELADAPLDRAGPGPSTASSPKRGVGLMVAALVVAAGVGGYFAFGTGGGDRQPLVATAQQNNGAEGEALSDPSAAVSDIGTTAVPVVVALSVTSNPSGAAVSLDGDDTGAVTPASFPLEEPYPQTVALSLDGYEAASQDLPPVDGEPVAVAFELTREPTFGRVVLSGPYEFEVWRGNERLRSMAPEHDLTLATGSARLRIRNPEYLLDLQYSVEVLDGGRESVIAPALGSLTVFSNPGSCEIFVGDQSLGYLPISRRAAAPGTYTVERRCPNVGDNSQKDITIGSDREATVTFAPGQR